VQASLHLKLPGELPLADAHEVAEQIERAILESVPEVTAVQTHIEPLAEESSGRELPEAPGQVEEIVRQAIGAPPRETRFLHTEEGLVVLLTLGLDGAASLADAHGIAGTVEERIRADLPEVAEVIVHTEP
jgi:divalent metal cation (Fe/Co/Zn/Cd) transporter